MSGRVGLLLLLMLMSPIGQVVAQEMHPQKKRPYPLRISSKDTTSLHRKQLTFFPIVYRSPETGLAYGMLALGLFKMIGVKDSLTRTSNAELPIILTSQNQFVVDLLYNLITNKERFFIRGLNQYNKFSEYYFGIGNETPDASKTTVKYMSIKSNQRVMMRVKCRHFLGIQYQYYKVSNTSFSNPPPPDPSGGNLGLTGFTTSGLGPVYLYDSRDNVINSSRGTYLELSTLDANHFEGSQFDFINVTLDARKFFHLKNGQVFAVQGLFNHNSGDVPWRQMASMGGFSMMRGYYLGRHRDKNYAALQAEYRMHIWKFFGMTFFGSMGEVSPHVSDLSLDRIRYAGGAGLRFQVDKKERVNIRFDVGFGSGTPGYYLTIGEAF